MPLPGNLSTVTVTGKYVDFQGNAIRGQVRFTLPTDPLVDSAADVIVVPTTVTANLDENGSFTVTLPATDDADVYPNGVQYIVSEAFTGGRTYSLALPALPATVDLSTVAPTPTLSPAFVALTSDGFWNPMAANIATMRTQVDPATGNLLLSGVYAYLSLAYATYTTLNSTFATYSALNTGPYPVTGATFTQFATQAQNAATSAASSYNSAASVAATFLDPFTFGG